MASVASNFTRASFKQLRPLKIKASSKTFVRSTAVVGLTSAALATYYYNNDNNNKKSNGNAAKALFGFGGASGLNAAQVSSKAQDEYQEIYNAIAKKLQDEDEYDYGSYGPVLVRLAWHSSGTYDTNDKTGGSYGGTMRFAPESTDDANNGLEIARKFLDEFKVKYDWISYGDLWTLGGVCAVQELGGPKVKWRAGRVDQDASKCPPNGKLPDASRDAPYVRNLFARMGMTERETVALIGAHCLGGCHADRSGYKGPWTFSPTVFTNDFYKLILEDKWQVKKWDGPKQYEDVKTKSLMMLPADIALTEDSSFKKICVEYANDQDLFFKDFSAAFQKLLESGISYTKSTKEFVFKTLDEQE
ncbi:hypothetical protein BABINDRAFT_29825 [Babjeviella inositovora NRRL Y-12698]|uniref:Peroxidase n=1 Tax=Babjeviella inositovora NRRL Y-12698 TaxID=984486 RepID=A0A1E3QYV3_9ASCO|nr:uncharacterized protein BABINDRAFT_29825 [Babjeviella inositovora NRRL Y-12698]ODQ82795.1 hypothetical protein BABINDRAFT_29825 [Babjeviella inositovora NRRL Y-12698]